MRILIGSESFPPNISGVAVAAELLARNLAKRGHDVFALVPSRSYKTHADASFDSFTVIRIKSVPNPLRSGFRFGFMPGRDVRRVVEDVAPDVIHLQDPTSIGGALRRVANRMGTPLVITNHFSLDYLLSYVPFLSPFHPYMRKRLARWLARFYNRCDYVLCPTETVRRELLRWGVERPIRAISNGVDIERFYSYSSPTAIRWQYRLPADPLVLYVGRIDRDKNVETLVRAIPQVLGRTSAHFVFVGSGNEMSKIRTLVESLGVGRRVSFLGRIAHDSADLPKLYQVASVCAIPCGFETQSIVALEAMASGVPVVGARAGALPELIRDGETGLLVAADDPKALGDGIIRVLSDGGLATRLRNEALRAVSRHRIEASMSEVLAVYREVLDNHAPA